MALKVCYYPYSKYLKKKYNEKVYKLPVNLPVSCPNRINGSKGCSFCAQAGTGFEAQDASLPVAKQIRMNREYIEKRYNAHKFIAYFQNYTNTFLPLSDFKKYITEAAKEQDIVEISVSTRPDCIREDYLLFLKEIEKIYHKNITVELGLQTVNYRTLERVQRGHSLAEFLDAVLKIKKYGFSVCVHVILNLPGDERIDCIETAKVLSALEIAIVKIHSLYIAKDTLLCQAYENGTIAVCSKEEYLERLGLFLRYLSPAVAVERLFGRIPKESCVFANWGCSWWKLRDEFLEKMEQEGGYQGEYFQYLGGAKLKLLS